MNLSLIIDVLQQLISIMGYQNTSTCCNYNKYIKLPYPHIVEIVAHGL